MIFKATVIKFEIQFLSKNIGTITVLYIFIICASLKHPNSSVLMKTFQMLVENVQKIHWYPKFNENHCSNF